MRRSERGRRVKGDRARRTAALGVSCCRPAKRHIYPEGPRREPSALVPSHCFAAVSGGPASCPAYVDASTACQLALNLVRDARSARSFSGEHGANEAFVAVVRRHLLPALSLSGQVQPAAALNPAGVAEIFTNFLGPPARISRRGTGHTGSTLLFPRSRPCNHESAACSLRKGNQRRGWRPRRRPETSAAARPRVPRTERPRLRPRRARHRSRRAGARRAP